MKEKNRGSGRPVWKGQRLLYRVDRQGLHAKSTSEQKQDWRETAMGIDWGERVPGRGNHRSKVPGVEMSLTGSRKISKANVLV